jgi:hypothetical protein
MTAIYGDTHTVLKELLGMAGNQEDATLLIPDLQRPYVWQPNQVTVLIDSLIRGWPFGTLLTWQVRPDDPARDLARSFWRVVDRTDEDDGQPISMKNPPAKFQMVLDGQQRVQSLLLALGGDGWGFKLFDRQWHEHLNGIKPRGPRGKPHWSLGCLCVDMLALTEQYTKTKRITDIDYNRVLCWVVTDDANGQSKLDKPENYTEPLQIASKKPGHYMRLSRLWQKASEQAGADAFEAEETAIALLDEHGFGNNARRIHSRPVAALLMALKDVKQTRVTYLALSEYNDALGSREIYNDAIVNIFTRLNTAGRTLTREDITFAWLKIGWNTASTGNESARVCIEHLRQQLDELGVSLATEDIVSAISFVWSVSFNAGKLLSNDDLMKGEAIRPMAKNISEHWTLLEEAAIRICQRARDRGLGFREHYQSVNSLAYLWAWYFIAVRWRQEQYLKELDKDALEKKLIAELDAAMDRWLICTQWAGVWTNVTAQSLSGYATRLADRARAIASTADLANVVDTLREQLNAELKEIEQAAVNGIAAMNADDRQQVRTYYTSLWIWNRLEAARWNQAKLTLRQSSRRKNTLEVDHIVAFDLWQSKLEALPPLLAKTDSDAKILTREEAAPRVNDLGNCMLLEKNFNISKSNKPAKEFLQDVHEFKDGERTIESWAEGLGLEMSQLDPVSISVESLIQLFTHRTQRIKRDLEEFVRGKAIRTDL